MRWIPDAMKPQPYIIAEVGASHEGSLGHAVELIDWAAKAGANAVKFQLFDPDVLSARRHAESYLGIYRRYALNPKWLANLRERTRGHNLQFILSVYSCRDLDLAAPFADILKIASFECRDRLLLDEACGTGKTVIVSTGMTTDQDMDRLREWREAGANPRALLHCISAYPCPVPALNLATIRTYDLDGFSDHSGAYYAGGFAAACGAQMIEVHMRSYTTGEQNPDYKHALNPGALETYIKLAREGAAARGVPCRRVIERVELPMTAYRVGVPTT